MSCRLSKFPSSKFDERNNGQGGNVNRGNERNDNRRSYYGGNRKKYSTKFCNYNYPHYKSRNNTYWSDPINCNGKQFNSTVTDNSSYQDNIMKETTAKCNMNSYDIRAKKRNNSFMNVNNFQNFSNSNHRESKFQQNENTNDKIIDNKYSKFSCDIKKELYFDKKFIENNTTNKKRKVENDHKHNIIQNSDNSKEKLIFSVSKNFDYSKKLINTITNMDKSNIKYVINNPITKFDAAFKMDAKKRIREEMQKELKTMHFSIDNETIRFEPDECIDLKQFPESVFNEIQKVLGVDLIDGGHSNEIEKLENKCTEESIVKSLSNDQKINSSSIDEKLSKSDDSNNSHENNLDIFREFSINSKVKIENFENFENFLSQSNEFSDKNSSFSEEKSETLTKSDNSQIEIKDKILYESSEYSPNNLESSSKQTVFFPEKLYENLKSLMLPYLKTEETDSLKETIDRIFKLCVKKTENKKEISSSFKKEKLKKPPKFHTKMETPQKLSKKTNSKIKCVNDLTIESSTINKYNTIQNCCVVKENHINQYLPTDIKNMEESILMKKELPCEVKKKTFQKYNKLKEKSVTGSNDRIKIKDVEIINIENINDLQINSNRANKSTKNTKIQTEINDNNICSPKKLNMKFPEDSFEMKTTSNRNNKKDKDEINDNKNNVNIELDNIKQTLTKSSDLKDIITKISDLEKNIEIRNKLLNNMENDEIVSQAAVSCLNSSNELKSVQNSKLKLLPLIDDKNSNDDISNNMKEIDLKLMQLHQRKMYVDDMILKFQQEKISIDSITMQLQNEKYFLVNSTLLKSYLSANQIFSRQMNIETFTNPILPDLFSLHSLTHQEELNSLPKNQSEN